MIGTNFGIFRPSQSSSNSQNSSSQGGGFTTDGRPVNQLSDFVAQLEDYVPTVPDAVTAHFVNSAGFEPNDPRILRLISVATQKFISDVSNDALQHCKVRTHSQAGGGGASGSGQGVTGMTVGAGAKGPKPAKDRKYTLTMDDLTPALADHGITTRKAQYYV